MIQKKYLEVTNELLEAADILVLLSKNAEEGLEEIKKTYPDMSVTNFDTMLKGTNRNKTITILKSYIKAYILAKLETVVTGPEKRKDALITIFNTGFDYKRFGKTDEVLTLAETYKDSPTSNIIKPFFKSKGILYPIFTIGEDMERALRLIDDIEESSLSAYISETSEYLDNLTLVTLNSYDELGVALPLELSKGDEVGIADTMRKKGNEKVLDYEKDLDIFDTLTSAKPTAVELDLKVSNVIKEITPEFKKIGFGKNGMTEVSKRVTDTLDEYIDGTIAGNEFVATLKDMITITNNHFIILDKRVGRIASKLDQINYGAKQLNNYVTYVEETRNVLVK